MRLALTTCANSSFAFESRVAVNCSRRNLTCHGFFGRPRSLYKPVLTAWSMKASTGNPIDEWAKLSVCLHNVTSNFLNASSLKEFPWNKAKLVVEERVLFLGKNAFKWFLVVLLSFSFISDALLAVSVNRELLVPLGFFMGVTLADFFMECFKESFERSKGGNELQLCGIGLFFVALRILFLSFRIPGWTLFTHIGNGGLMQILWLAKAPQTTYIAQNKEGVDSLQPSRD